MTKKSRIYIIWLMNLCLITAVVAFFVWYESVPDVSPEKVLKTYMAHISNREYEQMYEMIDAGISGNISQEDFVKRNSAIYEGIDVDNIKDHITSNDKEQKEICYETSMDTVAGNVTFENKASFILEKGKYKLIWNDSLIFPELDSTDKVKVSTTSAKRGQIIDRNGHLLAGEGVASSIGVVPGEFAICEREQVAMADIVLSGVNKEKADILHVMKDCGGVGVYTIESRTQLELLQACAKETNLTIRALIRVTSGNQFGVDESELEDIIANRTQYPNIDFYGIQCYTGTQKKKMKQIEEELTHLDGLCDSLKEKYGWMAKEFEYGPGLLVSYFGEEALNDGFDELKEFAALLAPIRSKYEITLEMGRFIAASCGVFVSSVVDLKTNKAQNYCIIDGGINHINYYGQTMAMKIPAYTYVKADGSITAGFDMAARRKLAQAGATEKWTICGSLCTVGDVIVKNLPVVKPEIGDLILFYNIGAYSVTEGIYLFLSRRMPKIVAYSKKEKAVVYRDVLASDTINSRMSLVRK